jgi:lysozyme
MSLNEGDKPLTRPTSDLSPIWGRGRCKAAGEGKNCINMNRGVSEMRYSFLIPIVFCYVTSAMGTNARTAIEMLDISERGVNLIKRFEGCSLVPYKDSAGKWTVGWGHLIKDNEKENLMKGVTQAQADSLLNDDINIVAVRPLKSQVKVPLYLYEFDSLTSFTFNIGPGNFSESTLKTRLSEHRYHDASLEIPRWNKSNQVFDHGVFKRRMAEMLIFRNSSDIPDLLPVYSNHYKDLSNPLKNEIVQIYNAYNSQ